MERRKFLKAFGIGIAASTVPVAAAYAMKTTPVKKPPVTGNKGWLGGGNIVFTSSANTKASLTVGEDGHLWIKPHETGEWKRIALED
jgi:hypothetical protein